MVCISSFFPTCMLSRSCMLRPTFGCGRSRAWWARQRTTIWARLRRVPWSAFWRLRESRLRRSPAPRQSKSGICVSKGFHCLKASWSIIAIRLLVQVAFIVSPPRSVLRKGGRRGAVVTLRMRVSVRLTKSLSSFFEMFCFPCFIAAVCYPLGLPSSKPLFLRLGQRMSIRP